MEATLCDWFDLAEIWAAVMLIDEADIYLECRTTGDLQRNSLVSGKPRYGNITLVLNHGQLSCAPWNIIEASYSLPLTALVTSMTPS